MPARAAARAPDHHRQPAALPPPPILVSSSQSPPGPQTLEPSQSRGGFLFSETGVPLPPRFPRGESCPGLSHLVKTTILGPTAHGDDPTGDAATVSEAHEELACLRTSAAMVYSWPRPSWWPRPHHQPRGWDCCGALGCGPGHAGLAAYADEAHRVWRGHRHRCVSKLFAA